MKYLLILSVTFILAGCSDSKSGNNKKTDVIQPFSENVLYVYNINQAGFCNNGERVNPDQLENCILTLELFPDGRADFMITDIMNIGSYTRPDTNTIVLQMDQIDGGPGGSVVFTYQGDADNIIVDNIQGYHWVKQTE